MDSKRHWTEDYIGLPWIPGGRGPSAFDCWGLICDIYSKKFGLELPLHAQANACDPAEVHKLICGEVSSGDWEAIARAIPFCVVGMSAGKRIHHLGLQIPVDGGMILHSNDKSNITLETRVGLRRRGFQNIVYFKHKDHEKFIIDSAA